MTTSRPCRLSGIFLLGIVTIIATGGIIWLASIGRDIPQILSAISAGCIGALAGVLPSGAVRETSNGTNRHAPDWPAPKVPTVR